MPFLKKYLPILIVAIIILSVGSIVHAQNTDIENKIKEYQQKLTDIRQQKNTLSSQIQQMDTQISLTGLQIQQSEVKIVETQSEIEKLSSRIDNLDSSLNTLSKLLLRQIAKSYKTRSVSLVELLFETKDMNDLANKIKYLRSSQNNNQKLLVQVQEAKSSYEEQKIVREQKKQELDQLIISLNNQKVELKKQQSQKQRLLSETNNDETTYQSLLAQAQAQLKGFSSFVTAQGGSSILSNQTSCDDWGCYYNQRDSQWGNIVINGRYDCDGACSVSRVGCLITSVAMIVSHLGNRSILPSDIVYNSSNFSYGTASLNKGSGEFAISAKGVSINRTTISGSLSPDLLQNGPLIVGIYYGPFGTHFVVVKSYSDGKYIMNDPYTEGGKDKNFSDYYSLGSVFEVDRVSL